MGNRGVNLFLREGGGQRTNLHGPLEGMIITGDIGHDLTLVGLLIAQQVYENPRNNKSENPQIKKKF